MENTEKNKNINRETQTPQTSQIPQIPPLSPQLLTEFAVFEIRVKDLQSQYAKLTRLMVEENGALRQEIAELREKLKGGGKKL